MIIQITRQIKPQFSLKIKHIGTFSLREELNNFNSIKQDDNNIEFEDIYISKFNNMID